MILERLWVREGAQKDVDSTLGRQQVSMLMDGAPEEGREGNRSTQEGKVCPETPEDFGDPSSGTDLFGRGNEIEQAHKNRARPILAAVNVLLGIGAVAATVVACFQGAPQVFTGMIMLTAIVLTYVAVVNRYYFSDQG